MSNATARPGGSWRASAQKGRIKAFRLPGDHPGANLHRMQTTTHYDALNSTIRAIGKDKLVHVVVGVGIFAFARWATGNNAAALGAVAGLAVMREIYDANEKPHGWEGRDIIATMAGGALGYLSQIDPIG